LFFASTKSKKMGYLGFFYVEKKSFEFRSDVQGGIRLKEWSKGVHRWVIMAWPTISWFSEACSALSASGVVEGKYETFRFGDRRYVLMRRSNSFGSFLELSEFGGGGKCSSVIIPEGMHGLGWKDCQEQLLKLKQHHVRVLSACNGATRRKDVTQHGSKDEKDPVSYAEAVKSGPKVLQVTNHLGVTGAQAGFNAGEPQEFFCLGNGESMEGRAGLEKRWEGEGGRGGGKKSMHESFRDFKSLMTRFREEFDSFLENMEKVWVSVGFAGVDGSAPADTKTHEASGPKDGPDEVGQVSKDHDKPKSRLVSDKPTKRLITYVRRRAPKKVWRVKRKGRGSSPAAGELPLSNRCVSPVPAMSRSATVGHAGSDRPAREDDFVDGVPIGSQEVHAGEFLASEVAGRGDAGPLERCDEFQVAGFMPVTGRSGTQKTKSVSVTPECDDQVVGLLEVTQNGLGLSSPVVSLSVSPYRSFQQMFLGDHHLSVLKDQGTGSKSLPCAIILPSGSSGSCAPWRTEDACLAENVDSGMIVPYVQAEERLPDILCVRDISETAVEQCAAEEVQEVVPLTMISGREWLLDKVKELCQVWGMSYEGCEEELKALYHKIEGNRRKVNCPAGSPARSTFKGSRELRGLHSSVNYDGKMGFATRDQHTKRKARGGGSLMSNDA
jgi:hypothetical protein